LAVPYVFEPENLKIWYERKGDFGGAIRTEERIRRWIKGKTWSL
jgi:hypothetical protein